MAGNWITAADVSALLGAADKVNAHVTDSLINEIDADIDYNPLINVQFATRDHLRGTVDADGKHAYGFAEQAGDPALSFGAGISEVWMDSTSQLRINALATVLASDNFADIIDLTDLPGTLAVGHGGTGLATIAQYSIPYATAADVLGALATGTGVLAAAGGAPGWTATPTLTSLTCLTTDAGTATVVDGLTVKHLLTAPNHATTNFGVGLLFSGQDASDGADDMGRLVMRWSDATSGSEDTTFAVQLRRASGPLADVAILNATGGFNLAFDGATAVAYPFSASMNRSDGRCMFTNSSTSSATGLGSYSASANYFAGLCGSVDGGVLGATSFGLANGNFVVISALTGSPMYIGTGAVTATNSGYSVNICTHNKVRSTWNGSATGYQTHSVEATTSPAAPDWTLTPGADTAWTAAEHIGFQLSGATKTYVTGAASPLALHRNRVFGGNTYVGTTAMVLTEVVENDFAAPVAGANMTFTASYAARFGAAIKTTVTDTGTATAPAVATLKHLLASGSAAANFGVSVLFAGLDEEGDPRDMGTIAVKWDDPGAATADSAFTVQAVTAGASLADCLYVSGTKFGLFGVGPAARAAAFTQTYSTAGRTVSAYTADDESGAYTGAGDGEAKLADLNFLRIAVENLRARCEENTKLINSLIDDAQGYGLAQ